MKTVYLRQKKSGNFELSNKKESTHKFNSKKTALNFWNTEIKGFRSCRIIKATYSQSQTYFGTFDEFWAYIKKNN